MAAAKPPTKDPVQQETASSSEKTTEETDALRKKLRHLEDLRERQNDIRNKRKDFQEKKKPAKAKITNALSAAGKPSFGTDNNVIRKVPKHFHRKITKKTMTQALVLALGEERKDAVLSRAEAVSRSESEHPESPVEEEPELYVMKVAHLRKKKNKKEK